MEPEDNVRPVRVVKRQIITTRPKPVAKQVRTSATMKKIMYLLSGSPRTSKQMASIIGVGNDSIRGSLNRLADRGFVKRTSMRDELFDVEIPDGSGRYVVTNEGLHHLEGHREEMLEWMPFIMRDRQDARGVLSLVKSQSFRKEMVLELLTRLKGSEDEEFWEDIGLYAIQSHPSVGKSIGVMMKSMDDQGVAIANIYAKWNSDEHKFKVHEGWQLVDRGKLIIPTTVVESPSDEIMKLAVDGKLDGVLDPDAVARIKSTAQMEIGEEEQIIES